jgi:hypothetical protein
MPGPASQSYDPCPDPAPMSSPLTCDAVRALVEGAGKRWAVVISDNGPTTQFTTWGKGARDKVYASDLSEHLSRQLCGDAEPLAVYESFHGKDEAARNKEWLERLRDEVASVLLVMDGLAETWGDEAQFRRCRDRLRAVVAPPPA